MRRLSPRQKLALRFPTTRVALFVYMDHPDGPVYAWNGVGPLVHDGHTWRGCGLFAGITGVESTVEPSISNVAFVMAGVPGDALNLAAAVLKGRQAIIYQGIMTADDRVVGDLLVQDIVDLDIQEPQGQDDGTFNVVVSGQSGFWQLENASRLLWSPEQQKSVYPGDTGMDGLADLEDLKITWTRT